MSTDGYAPLGSGINWLFADQEMLAARGRLKGLLNNIMEEPASTSSAKEVNP